MNRSDSERTRLEYLSALEVEVWRERADAVADDRVADGQTAEPSRVDQCRADSVGPGDRETVGATVAVHLADWTALKTAVAGCTRCGLHKTRTQTVFGVGSEDADWFIVGEAPGAEEDRRGEPFVGRAGKLLDEMLRAVGLNRQAVFIANILKCRPPNNRDPAVDESAECRRYLDRQIELVAPKIILAVGRIAAQQLLATDTPVGRLRGQLHRVGDRGIPAIVTYHPAYLLRSPVQKRKVWQDLCMAKAAMERQGV